MEQGDNGEIFSYSNVKGQKGREGLKRERAKLPRIKRASQTAEEEGVVVDARCQQAGGECSDWKPVLRVANLWSPVTFESHSVRGVSELRRQSLESSGLARKMTSSQ